MQGREVVVVVIRAARMTAELVQFAGQKGVGAAVVLMGLKMGTPFAARAMAPRKKRVRAESGFTAGTGRRGNRQALSPRYDCGQGTCCCHAVMPTIIRCAGRPSDST